MKTANGFFNSTKLINPMNDEIKSYRYKVFSRVKVQGYLQYTSKYYSWGGKKVPTPRKVR